MASVPLDREEFSRWREEADRALASARLQTQADLHNWACFSAEQAAQFGVKALLHGLGRAPWGHNLVALGQMVADAGIEVPEAVWDGLRRLSRHYVGARYPDAQSGGSAGSHYGRMDAEQAIDDATAALSFADGVWSALGA